MFSKKNKKKFNFCVRVGFESELCPEPDPTYLFRFCTCKISFKQFRMPQSPIPDKFLDSAEIALLGGVQQGAITTQQIHHILYSRE